MHLLSPTVVNFEFVTSSFHCNPIVAGECDSALMIHATEPFLSNLYARDTAHSRHRFYRVGVTNAP